MCSRPTCVIFVAKKGRGRHLPPAPRSNFLSRGAVSALVLPSPPPSLGNDCPAAPRHGLTSSVPRSALQGLECPVPSTASVWSPEERLELPLTFELLWIQIPLLKTQSALKVRGAGCRGGAVPRIKCVLGGGCHSRRVNLFQLFSSRCQ